MISSRSIPAVGVAVMLRTLSTPEPLLVRPSSCRRSSTLTMFRGGISRTWRLARVVMSRNPFAPFLGEVGEAVHLRGGQFTGGDAHAQHQRFLHRADVEHAEGAEVIGVLLVGQLVVFGGGHQPVPDVEAVLFELPEFRLGEFGDRRAEDVRFGFLDGCRVVDQPRRGLARDGPGGGVADEGHEAALHHARHETGQIFLLRRGESAARWGGRGGEGCAVLRWAAHKGSVQYTSRW